MIAHIHGTVIFSGDRFVVVETGGVGYKLFVTYDTQAKLAGMDKASLWTHLVVREDVLDLYGFMTQSELSFFQMIITVSGIGPKSALGVLNVASVETLRSAIISGDTSYLTKVSGIGKKNAEKIVLELRDKLGADTTSQNDSIIKEDLDVIEALRALGYETSEARKALKEIPADIVGTSQKITVALKMLGK